MEMIELYMKKGMTAKDAATVVFAMSKYPGTRKEVYNSCDGYQHGEISFLIARDTFMWSLRNINVERGWEWEWEWCGKGGNVMCHILIIYFSLLFHRYFCGHYDGGGTWHDASGS